MRKWLAIAGVGGVIVLGGLFAGIRSAFYFPAEIEQAPVACPADAPVAPRGTELRILVWNIQFSANREQRFFYDGGEAVSVPPVQVERTLDRIARFIRSQDADIVLLQEVDRDSRRTGRLDQHAMLRERLELPCHTAAPYHRAAYVPVPSHEPMGRVDMNLSVFSRYKIDSSTRYQLPLLKESAVRRLFNLRRAALAVSIPLQRGGAVSILNTHLSAFSKNDGTLERQVDQLNALMQSRAAELGLTLNGFDIEMGIVSVGWATDENGQSVAKSPQMQAVTEINKAEKAKKAKKAEPKSLPTAYGPLGYNESPLGYANAPLGYANAPLGYANAPLGYSESPLSYANAPLGYSESPLGYANAPVGNDNSEVAYSQMPLGYSDAPLGYSDAPLGYSDAPLGYSEAPLGYSESPLGDENSDVTYSQMPLGYSNAPLGYSEAPLGYANAPLGYSNLSW